MFIVRMLRIHPVQSVVSNITQLSGIRVFPNFSFLLYFYANTYFIVCFLRIHPVQSVINNPTQLSGRGVPCIFHITHILSQLYFLLCSQMEAGPCKFWIVEIVVQT